MVRPDRKTLVDKKTRKADREVLLSRSADSTDVEHDAGMYTNSPSIGGGVLSALLTLYNQPDSASFSTASSSERLSRDFPPEKPWIRDPSGKRHRTAHEGLQRGRPSSMLSAELSPESSSRGSSVDSREGHRRGAGKSKALFSSIFSGGKLKQARSGAGVVGPLIAGTGNLMGVGSPVSSELQPDVKRPGYHLSRFV
jgi:hypothetical protein